MIEDKDVVVVEREDPKENKKEQEENKEETRDPPKEVNKERPSSTSPVQQQQAKDSLVKCDICGKLFNRNSFRFHVPQCEKKEKARKLKEEEEKLKEMRNSSYIIYDEYEPDKFIGKS